MGRKRIRQALPAMGSRAAEQGDGARRGAEARCARHRAPRLIPNALAGRYKFYPQTQELPCQI